MGERLDDVGSAGRLQRCPRGRVPSGRRLDRMVRMVRSRGRSVLRDSLEDEADRGLDPVGGALKGHGPGRGLNQGPRENQLERRDDFWSRPWAHRRGDESMDLEADQFVGSVGGRPAVEEDRGAGRGDGGLLRHHQHHLAQLGSDARD